ncbi:helix-turn-helix transcriptional regulator [Clostridium pasteurianum]|uniref:helix-turn-helix domain-containing protein n=1 Tax=Clostridium pasteurianum TaxID=1501 RepID=UPI00226101C0|nr:helix-turn-helix transcriptional regulator [Clostridium pasteurianum]UZW13836.1 helix-turn-helix transcriptional regulator [Clostridium pasteurianum]
MFGDNLKRIRKKSKLTQSELGNMVGVTGAYIQQLEKRRKSNPSLEVIVKICDALNVLPWEITEGDETMSKAIVSYITSLSPEELKESKNDIDIQLDSLTTFVKTILKEFKDLDLSTKEFNDFSLIVASWLREYFELTTRAKIKELINENSANKK